MSDTIIRANGKLNDLGPGPWGFETAVRTVWQEVRNQPVEGIQAVCHVIWNRLRTGKWGKTLASVCLWPRQFSGWNDEGESQRKLTAELPDSDKVLQEIRGIFLNSKNEVDFTKGALYYFNPEITPHPNWNFEKLEFTGVWGVHRFYKEGKMQELAQAQMVEEKM